MILAEKPQLLLKLKPRNSAAETQDGSLSKIPECTEENLRALWDEVHRLYAENTQMKLATHMFPGAAIAPAPVESNEMIYGITVIARRTSLNRKVDGWQTVKSMSRAD